MWSPDLNQGNWMNMIPPNSDKLQIYPYGKLYLGTKSIAWSIGQCCGSVSASLLTTLKKSLDIGWIIISPLSSVGTIFVVVPTLSAKVSPQFYLDMERYEGISSSPDVKWFTNATAKSCWLVLPLCVSEPTTLTRVYILRCLVLAIAAAALCSTVQCLVPISLLEIHSMVTANSLGRIPPLGTMVQTTCSLPHRWSIVVASIINYMSYCHRRNMPAP
jgi:hypothetical protein